MLRHWKIYGLVLLLIVLSVWPNLPVLAQETGRPLRVGLFYGASAPTEVSIVAACGLRLGQLKAGEEWPTQLWQQPGQVTWRLRPEKHGYYRVASDDWPDLAAAEQCRQLLGQGVLAWTGSAWQIWVGNAADAAAAESLQVELAETYPEQTWRVVAPDGSRSELFDGNGRLWLVLPPGDIYIGTAPGQRWQLAGQLGRGWLQLTQQAGRFRVINYVGMEDYLQGVVPREVSSSWPLEALKVQAVVSRTFAESSRGRHAADGFDLCATTHCQVSDHARETARSRQAIAETNGLVVTYNGCLAPVYFHSDAGGHTEDVINVWGGSVPYLVGVPELYPTNSGYEHWEKELTASQIQQLLEQNGQSVGTVLAVEPTGCTAAGRVQGLRITGSAASIVLEKEAARLRDSSSSLFYRLPSRMYTVEPQGLAVTVLAADGPMEKLNPSGLKVATAQGTRTLARTDSYHLLGNAGQRRTVSAQPSAFLFKGSGFGHGVGVSQHGARTMAERGHTFADILKYYLRGTEITKLGD